MELDNIIPGTAHRHVQKEHQEVKALHDTIAITSCLGDKFLLSNIKVEKKYLLYDTPLLKSVAKNFLSNSVVEKEYFDTTDFFFQKAGINICVSQEKYRKDKEIVVRYDSEKKRISYLSFMPDTYIKKIDAKASIFDHLDFVSAAILEMIINGFQTDILPLLKTMKPVITATKKRETWKYNFSNGLKLYFSFDNVEYKSILTKDKQKMDFLEIMADNNTKDYSEIYNKFTTDLVKDLPTILKVQHSDLFIAMDYLLNMK